MKFIPAAKTANGLHRLELTRRNLEALLAKLDDPNSARTLVDPDRLITVTAVENAAHYADRPAGPTLTNGVLDDGTSVHEPPTTI